MKREASAAEVELSGLPSLKTHPRHELLWEIVTGETNVSSAGYPYISDRSFRLFIEGVAHLFEDGAAILSWLRVLEEELAAARIASVDKESVERAVKVLRTVVLTAGVTAPPDLWLLKQVLSTHKKIGTLDWLLAGNALEPDEYAEEHGLSLEQLRVDLHFLYARGYLRKGDSNFLISDREPVAKTLGSIGTIGPELRVDFVPRLIEWFESKGSDRRQLDFLNGWLRIAASDVPTGSWRANHFQIELGYRLLPLVLSLRALEITGSLVEGAALAEHVPALVPEMSLVFDHAGLIRNGRVSELGARVFRVGPGPFGIIGSYHPYLNQLEALLASKEASVRVRRGDNVAASQDANRKTFKAANDRLDDFCREYGFEYAVFIEHAVGQGEAIRQRFERSGEEKIKYFGADLEDAAIDQAIAQQERGNLPRNMRFIRSADIGEPRHFMRFLEREGVAELQAVMMVGNGFHEIRDQTNERMIEVFRAYREAGFVLIFTEETALSDEALLHTAWNTYHAGFRYVHEMSGQGLRPAWERGDVGQRWSWRKCATEGGFVVLDEYSYRSRTIYPHKRPQHKNPSISVTYFCVPRRLAGELGIEAG